MTTPLIRVDAALCRIDARHTLKVDRFAISTGEHWCVFGGNGAGKSLLAALLLGALTVGRSHVHFARDFDVQRDVAVVSFEEQQRLWWRDDRHDVSEYSADAADSGTTVAALLGADQDLSDMDQSRRQLVQDLGLTGLLDRGIRFLSSGQVRRALLARALMQRPRLLVLDEPLESIDRESRERLVAVIETYMGADTATLLLCRHKSGILPGITHMAVMSDLVLIDQGPIAQVSASSLQGDGLLPATRLPARLPGPAAGREPEALDASQSLIRLDGVSARYQDKTVFTGLNWVMNVGDHSLVQGPNGCGKSTLLALVDGDNHMAYGQQVTLFGRRRGTGESIWDIKARFGVVSNELHNRYVRGWRVLDVVVSGFFDSVGLYDDSGASERQCALAWLDAFGLRSMATNWYHELSFGEQRMVLLARAMIKQPVILVLDEPCVGLDAHYRAMILEAVDRIAAGGRTHILYVSHTSGEAPDCINQRLTFRPEATGGFTVDVERV